MTHLVERNPKPSNLVGGFLGVAFGATGQASPGGGLEMLIFQGLPGKSRAGSPKRTRNPLPNFILNRARRPAPDPRPLEAPGGPWRFLEAMGGPRRALLWATSWRPMFYRPFFPEARNPKGGGHAGPTAPPRGPEAPGGVWSPRFLPAEAAGGREELGKGCWEHPGPELGTISPPPEPREHCCMASV